MNVLNYAADGFTSSDMLNGQQAMISWSARDKANDLLPIEHFRIPFKPLETLKNKRTKIDGVAAVV